MRTVKTILVGPYMRTLAGGVFCLVSRASSTRTAGHTHRIIQVTAVHAGAPTNHVHMPQYAHAGTPKRSTRACGTRCIQDCRLSKRRPWREARQKWPNADRVQAAIRPLGGARACLLRLGPPARVEGTWWRRRGHPVAAATTPLASRCRALQHSAAGRAAGRARRPAVSDDALFVASEHARDPSPWLR